MLPQTDTVSLELTCSNRDLPHQLAHGVAGGDLSIEGGSPAKAITLLRKPTRPLRFRHGRSAQWRLISHLSLNQLSLSGSTGSAEGNAAPVRPVWQQRLRAAGRRHSCAGAGGACDDLMPGRQFASVVRGLEIRLTINEAHFVGTGVAAFAQVMDHFRTVCACQ